MARTGAKVQVPVADLGPVSFNPTTESIEFKMGDTGQVIDALMATARELGADWAPSVGGDRVQTKT